MRGTLPNGIGNMSNLAIFDIGKQYINVSLTFQRKQNLIYASTISLKQVKTNLREIFPKVLEN